MKTTERIVNAAVLVAALGYFVDIYDLLLFSIVRVPSLQSLGLAGKDITGNGILLLNVQMTGLLAGGICWGILGDRKGRLSVLFGSIFIYSIANIANAFVHSVTAYAVWRGIAGFGLAGELGAGITLVAEILPKEKRGIGTTLVAAVGVSGAVAAFFIARWFTWRTTFLIGGGLGISLLCLRIGVSESGLFGQMKAAEVPRGDFRLLFTDSRRLLRYLRCIVIGIPLWFVVGILITLSPEFGRVLHVDGPVDAGAAVACCYAGLVIGDISSGLLSQYLESRIKVVYIFLSLSALGMAVYFFTTGESVLLFYGICLLLGFSVGYWVIFMTIATEQFGTNIRATVTTTVPNFVRGAVVPLSMLFTALRTLFHGSLISAGVSVGLLCLLPAFWSLGKMQETFHKDMNYSEK